MQTLGLAAETAPTDGMFKRLFWPTIENQYDLDLVSHQGFWVCFLIGVVSLISFSVAGQWIVGLLVAITYLLGAMGVRERSIPAAILIFTCYTMDRLSGFFMGQPPIGIVPIACFLLLFSNVRATMLAHRWERSGTAEQIDAIERADSSFMDKLSNVLPSRLWPTVRYFFFPLAAILLALTVAGIVMYPTLQRKQMERQQLLQQKNLSPETQVIEVTPDK